MKGLILLIVQMPGKKHEGFHSLIPFKNAVCLTLMLKLALELPGSLAWTNYVELEL